LIIEKNNNLQLCWLATDNPNINNWYSNKQKITISSDKIISFESNEFKNTVSEKSGLE
jgi:hypothetical protein